MPNTFITTIQNCAPASNKSMLSIFNADATKIIKVYRIWLINTKISAIGGAMTTLEIQLLTNRTNAGTAVTSTHKMDSTTTALSASVYCETNNGANIVAGNTLRRILINSDESKVSTSDNSSWNGTSFGGLIWDSGYGNSVVQPITLRQTQGIHVKNTGGATAGGFDLSMEFTQE